MPVFSTRLDGKLQDQVAQFAKKRNEGIAKSLRQLIEYGLAVAIYKDQNTENAENESLQERLRLEKEYKRNFEFMALEVAALLKLIVKESGQFSAEEATRLLAKARSQVENYMKRYEPPQTQK